MLQVLIFSQLISSKAIFTPFKCTLTQQSQQQSSTENTRRNREYGKFALHMFIIPNFHDFRVVKNTEFGLRK